MIYLILIVLILLLVHVNIRLRNLVTVIRLARSRKYSKLKLENNTLKEHIKTLEGLI